MFTVAVDTPSFCLNWRSLISNCTVMFVSTEEPVTGMKSARTFIVGAVISAGGRMGFDFIGRPVGDVHAAAVRLPRRNARGETLVGVGDAAIVLFAELVLFRIRRRIAAQPELLDELLALFVGGQPAERFPLFVADDVDDLFVQPLLIRSLELLAQLLFLLLLLFVGERLRDGLTLALRLLLLARLRGCLGNEKIANRAEEHELTGPHELFHLPRILLLSTDTGNRPQGS